MCGGVDGAIYCNEARILRCVLRNPLTTLRKMSQDSFQVAFHTTEIYAHDIYDVDKLDELHYLVLRSIIDELLITSNEIALMELI